MSARLLVTEPVKFLAWVTDFRERGWRADPAANVNTSVRGLTYETMADLWNAWYGVTFEEGLQDD